MEISQNIDMFVGKHPLNYISSNTYFSILKFIANIKSFIRRIFHRRGRHNRMVIAEAQSLLSNSPNIDHILSSASKTEDWEERKLLVKKIADYQTAKIIVDHFEGLPEHQFDNSKKKFVLELDQLKRDIERYSLSKVEYSIQNSLIALIQSNDNAHFDEAIENLKLLSQANWSNGKIVLGEIPVEVYNKRIENLNRIIGGNSLLNRHKERLANRLKQEEVLKRKVRQNLSRLENLIDLGKLEDAKISIRDIAQSIRPDFTREIQRLTKAKERLDSKIIAQFVKVQKEQLERESEKARILKEELEEQEIQAKILFVKKNEERRAQEKVLSDKRARLDSLLSKKFNWREIQQILLKNNISVLYHFTDASNYKSIVENGGLYSWHYCDRNGIEIPRTGNSPLGRSLDMEFGLEDYVRLSFIQDHPMKHVALREGRISKTFLLKVSIDVCYYENTKFSNMNAADRKHVNDDSPEFLSTLRFDLFKKRYLDLTPEDKKYHQAEVLVKTWIPLEQILNINDFAA